MAWDRFKLIEAELNNTSKYLCPFCSTPLEVYSLSTSTEGTGPGNYALTWDNLYCPQCNGVFIRKHLGENI